MLHFTTITNIHVPGVESNVMYIMKIFRRHEDLYRTIVKVKNTNVF